ncbi:hem peroxidase [Dillenia turbinata]|uniref:Peroxidase n=1 Tax=Dillenia turbinata TaxID=194707 RepID=A0AAN8YYB5_9MAGN
MAWMKLVLALLIFRIASLSNPTDLPSSIRDQVPIGDVSAITSHASRLSYDFYRNTCPAAEEVVWTMMSQIVSKHKDVSPAQVRLFFHDYFIQYNFYLVCINLVDVFWMNAIQGCDGSVLLNFSSNPNSIAEKSAIPNRTLRDFDHIDAIKEAMEKSCPVVSCADILALATRDGVVLIGDPYHPVLTGRRDSKISYFNEATSHIPRPTDNVTQFLRAFAERGFNARETVALLGHNIGRMGCRVIRARFNFSGAGNPDPSIPADLQNEMRRQCPHQDQVNSESPSPAPSSDSSAVPAKSNNNSMPNGEKFGAHFYKNLLKGRSLIFSDQQLTASPITARIVRANASDEGGEQGFRSDFARAMKKLSNLNVLTGDEGEIRLSCSLPRNTRVLDYGMIWMV